MTGLELCQWLYQQYPTAFPLTRDWLRTCLHYLHTHPPSP